MTAPTDLPARLRELVAYAEAGGAPEPWLQETAQALIEVLLASESRVEALQACARLRALADERRAAGYGAGAVIAAVMAAGRVSRATAYRILSQARETTPGVRSPRTSPRSTP